MRRALKILGRYLWDRRWPACLLLAAAVLFFAVISLYRLPLQAVLYAGILGGCVCLAGCAADFYAYRKKHGRLERLSDSIGLRVDGFPAPSTLIEEDYQQLIRQLDGLGRELSLSNDRALSEMTDYYTMWAHQIKTPIAAMRLLIQSGETEESRLLAELFKIEQYVEMVLAYIRLGSDQTDYVLKRYALDGILRQAVRKYARLFILKGIALDFAETGAVVLTDEKWLGFVCEQLLSNAVKYTNDGSVSIYLEDGRLVIEDTGIGIPETDLPRIFEKGFTGYNGRIDKRSTGLGLYLCGRILGRLSHTIRIESAAGRGTRAIVGFPREAAAPE